MSLYKWPLLDGPVSGLRHFMTNYTLNRKLRVKWVPCHYDKPQGWRWKGRITDLEGKQWIYWV